jgi:parvulin-like peptidyl-prolyl isomerase
MDSRIQVGDIALDGRALVERLGQYGLLPALVQELMVEQAIAAIALTPAEADQAEADFCQRQQLTTPETQAAWASQRYVTPATLRTVALREARLAKFKAATFQDQVESYFLQRKRTLDKVQYSLLRTKDLGLSQELYFRIQDDGVPFAEVAREYAEGQEAETGGLIGPVELSVPHPNLAQLLAISQPGQLWPPKRIGDWFIIVRLEKFIPAQLDDPTRQRLQEELFKRWVREKMQAIAPGGLPLTAQPEAAPQPSTIATTAETLDPQTEPSDAAPAAEPAPAVATTPATTEPASEAVADPWMAAPSPQAKPST